MGWEEYVERVTRDFEIAGHKKLCGHDVARDADDALIGEYRSILDEAADEKPLQAFLELHPEMLAAELGMYCRWVLPRSSLAGKYVPDFLTARLDSSGLTWTLVELESPRAKLFTQDGRPSKQLNKGLAQISDWRTWLMNNQDMARRPKSQDGLGLLGITSMATGLVIIGREEDRSEEDQRRLQQVVFNYRSNIRSYDWLVRDAYARREFRAKFGKHCDECAAK